jgi:hypothetical protein
MPFRRAGFRVARVIAAPVIAATVIAATVWALTACQSAPPRIMARPLNFGQFSPIVLDAASIDVVDASRPSTGGAHIESQLPQPPADAVRQWASQRLVAQGRGRVRLTIKDARIVEVQLPRTGGVKGYFTTDQAQRYDGRIEVEVNGDQTGANTFHGFTQAVASQSTTVAETISAADREATLMELVRRMMDDINARLDAGIRKDLAPMVVR